MRGIDVTIGFARDLRRLVRYRRPYVTTLYKGVYPTYDAARHHLPPDRLKGFDHQSVVEYHQEHEHFRTYSDYPIAFWLAHALQTASRVFDLGGGLGQSFYSFRDLLKFPRSLEWTVFDLPSFVDRGRALSLARGEQQLHFTVDLAQASQADVLFTDGALQYIEDDLATILSRLDHRPQHLLINRLPLDAGPGYYTNQRSQHSYCVYKVAGRAQFLEALQSQSYVLRDVWELPRSLDVMFHPERRVPTYSGFYAVQQPASARLGEKAPQ